MKGKYNMYTIGKYSGKKYHASEDLVKDFENTYCVAPKHYSRTFATCKKDFKDEVTGAKFKKGVTYHIVDKQINIIGGAVVGFYVHSGLPDTDAVVFNVKDTLKHFNYKGNDLVGR